MESYSIHDVERLTGIKAHTLRIWEKRYLSIVPHRTNTNIRYYDDDQVRRLLNIATLLEYGHKPSFLLAQPGPKLDELVLQAQHKTIPDVLDSTYVNELVTAMIAYDEIKFEKVFSTALTRYGLHDTIIKVIYPFLEKTGVLWSTKGAMPAQEHFATNILKRKLMAAIDGLPWPDAKNKKFLLFLPSEEWHEIGLLFAYYLIRAAGHTSIYLGQSVPFSNLEQTIKKTRPDFLLTFFISAKTRTTKKALADLAVNHPEVNILLCTNKLTLDFDDLKNIRNLTHPNQLSAYV